LILEALVAAHMPQVLTVSAYDSLLETGHGEAPVAEKGAAREALAALGSGDEARRDAQLRSCWSRPRIAGLSSDRHGSAKPPRVYELGTTFAHETAVAGPARAICRPEIKSSSVRDSPVLYSSDLPSARTSLTSLTFTPFDDLAAREKAWAGRSAPIRNG